MSRVSDQITRYTKLFTDILIGDPNLALRRLVDLVDRDPFYLSGRVEPEDFERLHNFLHDSMFGVVARTIQEEGYDPKRWKPKG